MQESERKALIAALRDQTEFGRLNASVIEAGFAKIEELGFQIVRKEEPKPVAEANPEPQQTKERFASQPVPDLKAVEVAKAKPRRGK